MRGRPAAAASISDRLGASRRDGASITSAWSKTGRMSVASPANSTLSCRPSSRLRAFIRCAHSVVSGPVTTRRTASRSMMWTTVPTLLIVLAVYALVGVRFGDQILPADRLRELAAALDAACAINLWCLLPLAAMIALILLGVAAEPAMIAAAAIAVLLAVTLQGADPAAVLNALYDGGTGTTGIESLDSLLGRGGILSMMWTLSLALGGYSTPSAFCAS